MTDWPWQDFIIRDVWTDDGSGATSGTVYLSPDIMPRGTDQPPLSWVDIINYYDNGPNLGLPINGTGPNYIYVRIKNLQKTGTESGWVNLYWADPSLLLTPDQWHQLATAGGQKNPPVINQAQATDLQSGDIGCSMPPFLLDGSTPTLPGHVCNVAIVQTPKNQVVVPTKFGSNAEWANFVQQHPNVGWRNNYVVAASVPQIVNTYRFGSKSASPEDFSVKAIANGYPTGTQVLLQCRDASYSFDQELPLPEPDPNDNGNQVVEFALDQVPGNFLGTLIATVTPNGSFTPPATLYLDYGQWQSDNDDPELVARVGRPARITDRSPARRSQSDYPMIIPVGQCSIWSVAQV